MLAQVDAHPTIVLTLCALALIGNYLFWIANLRLGWRAKATEVAPQLSRRAFTLGTLAALVVTAVSWLVIKSALDDQLYLTIFGFTVFFCGPWYLALMWRRQNTAGQSVLGWAGYLMMPVFYWPATAILSPTFRTPLWIAFGVITALLGVANIVCIRYLDARSAASPDSSVDSVRVAG